MLLIALTGASGSGKSTVGDRLVSEHGFTKMRFAQPVKDMLMALGLSALDVDGPQEHRRQPHPLLCGKSPRHALQTLGTDWRDLIDPTLWARIMVARLTEEASRGRDRIVIDDLRFAHELDLLGPFDPVVLSVRRTSVEPTREQLRYAAMRPSLQRVARLMGVEIPHVSETEWLSLPYDLAIRNDGDIDELNSRLDKALSCALSCRKRTHEDESHAEPVQIAVGQLLA